MKNIDKYPNTKDAANAYHEWRKICGLENGEPFDYWLECDYVEPKPPTLLEAAKKVVYEYNTYKTDDGYCLSAAIEALKDSILREEKKPRRNCDVMTTAKELDEAYHKFCREHCSCEECQCTDPNYNRIGSCKFAFALAPYKGGAIVASKFPKGDW